MKKFKNLILTILGIGLLTGCNSSSLPSTSSSKQESSESSSSVDSSSSTSSSSSSKSSKEAKWDNDLSTLMKDLLGEVIPYFAFDEATFTYAKYTDDNGDYLYLGDQSNTDTITSVYGTTLTSAGYTFDQTNDDGGYISYFYSKGKIVIQYQYFAGEEGSLGCNEIYAWVDDPTVGSWSQEIESKMNEVLGTTLPYYNFPSIVDYGSYEDEGLNYFYLKDSSSTDIVSKGYASVLKSNGYYNYLENDDLGYKVYTYANQDISIGVQIYFAPASGEEGAINGVIAWYYGSSSSTGKWSADVIADMKSVIGEALPYIDLGDTYMYGVGDNGNGPYFYITAGAEEDLVSAAYGPILEDAGYEFDTSSYEKGYLTKLYTKGDIVVEFGFFPGDDDYTPANEINAWIDNGEGGKWDLDVAESMESLLGETLPYIDLDVVGFGITSDDDGEYFFLFDDSEEDLITTTYGAILEEAGYEFASQDSDYGYLMVFYTKGSITVQFDYFPGDDDYSAGNEIYAWIEGESFWYSDYLSLGYDYADIASGGDIQDILELDVTPVVPTYEEEGLVYALPSEDEVGLSIIAYGDLMEDYVASLKEASYRVYEGSVTLLNWELWAYEDIKAYNCFDSILDHYIQIYVYEELTYISYYKFSSLYISSLTEDSAWTQDVGQALEEIGVNNLPFVQLGSNYDFSDMYYEDYGVYMVYDKYYLDLVSTYGESLKEAGYVQILDEDSDFYGCYYIKDSKSGADIYIDAYWNYGNIIEIYVFESIPAGTFDLTVATQVTKNTDTEVVFTSGPYYFTIEQKDSQTTANNYLGGGENGTRMYKGQFVTLSWDATESPSTITLTSVDNNYAANIKQDMVTGGTVSTSGSVTTITIDPGASEVTINCTNKVRLLSIVFDEF